VILGIAGAATLLVVLLTKTFLIEYFRIPQDGMAPGLPEGSTLWIWKRAYSAPAQVQRGDIIVFARERAGKRYNYIWRVIGLPGDRIETRADELVINGAAVKRDYERAEAGADIYLEHNGEASYEVRLSQTPKDVPPDVSLTVPADQFFVMGDNRLNARDSRSDGPVPFDAIIGRKL
jgi:signal peptidase I